MASPKPAPKNASGPGRTRSALLGAGTEAFAQHGFDGATTEQIAQAPA